MNIKKNKGIYAPFHLNILNNFYTYITKISSMLIRESTIFVTIGLQSRCDLLFFRPLIYINVYMCIQNHKLILLRILYAYIQRSCTLSLKYIELIVNHLRISVVQFCFYAQVQFFFFLIIKRMYMKPYAYYNLCKQTSYNYIYIKLVCAAKYS